MYGWSLFPTSNTVNSSAPLILVLVPMPFTRVHHFHIKKNQSVSPSLPRLSLSQPNQSKPMTTHLEPAPVWAFSLHWLVGESVLLITRLGDNQSKFKSVLRVKCHEMLCLLWIIRTELRRVKQCKQSIFGPSGALWIKLQNNVFLLWEQQTQQLKKRLQQRWMERAERSDSE